MRIPIWNSAEKYVMPQSSVVHHHNYLFISIVVNNNINNPDYSNPFQSLFKFLNTLRTIKWHMKFL